MREMKDSGVEWIGEIPIDWSIIQIKKLLAARDGGSWGEEPQDDQLDRICYRVADFDFSRLAIVSDAEFTIRNYTQPIIDKLSLERGDILVEKSGGGDKTPVGRAVFYDKDKPALFANFIERLRVATETSPRYFFYVWIALYLTGFTNNYIKQTTGIQNLDIKSLVSSVFVPSFDYKLQHCIANYLDAKCAQIDRAIARQQEVIEKLKEYKLSAITEAVTKGLNPDVTMKDSGIEWIGEIPKGWKTIRVKWLLVERKDRSNDGLEEPLSMSQKFGLIPTREMDMVPNMASSFIGAKLVCENDLVFNKLKAHLGVFSVSKYQGLVSPDYAVYYASGRADLKYLEYLFKTPQCIWEFRKNSSGIADGLTRLYTDGLYSIECPLPDKEEQLEIARVLNEKCACIEATILRKQDVIGKLTEYKKSLIYEVVTGKREV